MATPTITAPPPAVAEQRSDRPPTAGRLRRPEAPPALSGGRLVQLDILRGLAILLVLGHHSVIGAERAGILAPVARFWHGIGWAGVDLFFVLSGFLVGGLLFKELRAHSRLDVPRFLVRRLFKIWPAYFVYLAFVVAMREAHVLKHVGSSLPNFLHLQNYLGSPRPHTWSLAVEEHFYLFLPLFLLLLVRTAPARGGHLRVIPACALLLAACAAVRCAVNAHAPFMPLTHQYPTHLRMDSLLFGVLLAYLHHVTPHRLESLARRRGWLLAAGAALVIPVALRGYHDPFVSTAGFTLLYLGCGAILLGIVFTPVRDGWLGRFFASPAGRALAFVGGFSYPIYLWHWDLALLPLIAVDEKTRALASHAPALYWLAVMLAYVLAATAAGVLMGRLIEKPALALRDRLFPSRTDAAASGA